MQRVLYVLATLALAACAAPDQKQAEQVYDEPATVTGSRIPRKVTPGVQSVEGDAVRAQGAIAPGRGLAGSKGQQ